MNNMPSNPVDDLERAAILAALYSARNSVNSATLYERDKNNEAPVYAERLLFELSTVVADLNWTRRRLVSLGRRANVPFRRLQDAASISQGTCHKWAHEATDDVLSSIPVDAMRHLNLDEDDPDDRSVEALLAISNISPTAADVLTTFLRGRAPIRVAKAQPYTVRTRDLPAFDWWYLTLVQDGAVVGVAGGSKSYVELSAAIAGGAMAVEEFVAAIPRSGSSIAEWVDNLRKALPKTVQIGEVGDIAALTDEFVDHPRVPVNRAAEHFMSGFARFGEQVNIPVSLTPASSEEN